ncbi:MFS transporter [Demequina soli]|uniref:MFS transporter n=1 Tax=Demequina soli TaxID=1638987 RepID=UPI00078366B3|nr:MFS transporter [Demequina soli]
MSSTEVAVDSLPEPIELAAGEAPQQAKPWSKRYIALLFLAQFAIYVGSIAPGSFSMSLKIAAINPDAKESLLAVVLTTAAVVLIFINPLTGVLSDATRSRFGRRRPWMVGGLMAGILGYGVIAISSSFAVVLVGWVVGYIGLVTMGAMLLTHMGDSLPEKQRGMVAGVNGAITQVAAIAGVVVAGVVVAQPALTFMVPVAVTLLGSAAFIIKMNDPSSLDLPRTRVSVLGVYKTMLFNPRQHPDFAWTWISKLSVFIGIYMFSVYTVYFIGARLGIDASAIAALSATAGAITMITSIVGALGSGWLSDKIGRRKPLILVSGALMAVAFVVTGSMTTVVVYIFGAVVFSLASGIFGAVDQALTLDVIPDRVESGRWVAIMALANEIPKAIAPVVAAVVLAVIGGGDNYAMVYYVGAVFGILGGLLVLPIRSVR